MDAKYYQAYQELLTKLIENGIEGARKDYAADDPIIRAKLEGSIRGFEDCRGKTPEEIQKQLETVAAEVDLIRPEVVDKGDTHPRLPDYWRAQCRFLEVMFVRDRMAIFNIA